MQLKLFKKALKNIPIHKSFPYSLTLLFMDVTNSFLFVLGFVTLLILLLESKENYFE